MNVVDSIQKAREKGVSDEQILEEIRKQNPDKEVFFKKAEERGATETQIIEEIIKQNKTKEESKSPSPIKEDDKKERERAFSGNREGKTLLTKEAQQKEEEMRKQFLKRIEAKEKGESGDEDQVFSPTVSPEEATEMRNEEGASLEKPSSKKTVVFVIVGVGIVVLLVFLFLLFNVI